jgi:transposase
LDDIEAVRSKLRALASEGKTDEVIDTLLQMLVSVRDDNTALRVRLHNAIRQIFGRKSEQVSVEQLELALGQLTDVPQAAADIVKQDADDKDNAEPTDPAAPDGQTVPVPERKPKKLSAKRARSALPEDLPRETVRILVEDDLRACLDCGAQKKTIGFATTETLEFVPAHFKLVAEELEKVACPNCESGVVVAQSQKVMDRGLPGPGLLANIVISKGQNPSRSTGSRTFTDEATCTFPPRHWATGSHSPRT